VANVSLSLVQAEKLRKRPRNRSCIFSPAQVTLLHTLRTPSQFLLGSKRLPLTACSLRQKWNLDLESYSITTRKLVIQYSFIKFRYKNKTIFPRYTCTRCYVYRIISISNAVFYFESLVHTAFIIFPAWCYTKVIRLFLCCEINKNAFSKLL